MGNEGADEGVGTLRVEEASVARGPEAFDQGDLSLGRMKSEARTVH